MPPTDNFGFNSILSSKSKTMCSTYWKKLGMGNNFRRGATGVSFRPIVFLVYINDLTYNVNCDIKKLADDTSLFSYVDDPLRSALQVNEDLETVKLWVWQWKMHFNAEKTEEVVFSCKRYKPNHPPLLLGNDQVAQKMEHKHVGVILDSKLDFQSNTMQANLKARRGIGMIRYLSKDISRNVLDQIYKLYVRPHLNYGDIIYHRYNPEMQSHFTQALEQTQYSAALAVTVVWRDTSRQKLNNKLGWESLHDRRWYRRLCHFFVLKKQRTPQYLVNEIPNERQLTYNFRNPRAYDQNIVRTNRFANIYFQNTFMEWNKLDNEVKYSIYITQFKNKLLSIIRPMGNSIYNIHDVIGVRYLIKLRLQFSALSEHKFRHNFDCLSPFCICGIAKDDEHFLLHCPLYDEMRSDLLGQISEIPGLDISQYNLKSFCTLLLYGSPLLNVIANRMIMEATISFIKETKRFE